MKIIYSDIFRKSQIGPAYENIMESQIEREELARKRMRELEDGPKKKSKPRPPRKSIFDILSLNERAKEMDKNKESKLDSDWQGALGKLKN